MSTRIRVAVGLCLSFLSAITLAATGRTPGQFALSPVGSAQYSIPLWTPPGPKGIQPQLALTYDSQSGVGPVGVGWQLSGLGAISRCSKTYAQDTTPAAVALATSDGYCLNGNRLRLTSGTYGTAGSTYQTEIADFSNVTANSSAGNGPGYFTVQGRDGLTYQYGYTDANGNGANSQVLANGSTTASFWLLSKVSDRAGNNFVVNYTLLTGTAVPHTILWTPTSSGASSYTYTMTFNYGANAVQSSLNKYIGGTALQNPDLLSSIAISDAGTVVRDYFLGYQASPTTGRDEMISVKECADSAQSNCLLPTNVGYQNGAIGASTTSTSALSSSGAYLTARYDLNGDGFPDLVYYTGTTWYVAFGASSGYGSPINIGLNTGNNAAILIGNLTGQSSSDGILANNGGTWYAYAWNGSSFTGTSTGIAYDSTALQYQLADVDGDGLPDLVSLYVSTVGPTHSAKVDTRLNTSTAGTVGFSSTLTSAYTLSGVGSAQLQTPDNQYAKIRRYDFNGDGRDDLVLQVVTGTSPNYLMTTYELLSTGTSFTATSIASVSSSTFTPVFFTQWNDDACTDFVSAGILYISGCNGTTTAQSASLGTVLAAVDWDGDGRIDLVVANGSNLGVYMSTGSSSVSLTTTSIPYVATCQYITLDANSDGLDDLGCWSQSGANAVSYYLHAGAGTPPDLATSFIDGFGNATYPAYVSITQPATAYTATNDQTFPYRNYLSPLYVAWHVVFSDPSTSAGTYTWDVDYEGASLNLQGRGFSGFGVKQTFDSRNGFYESAGYNRVFPNTGMLAYDVVFTDMTGVQTISDTSATLTSTTLDATANNQRYFPYASNVVMSTYEVGGADNGQLTKTTSRAYTYDNYGNATTVATTITDDDSNSPYYGDQYVSTRSSTISPNVADWCLTLPTQTTITHSSSAPGGTAITRTVGYTPDYANCRQSQKVVEPSSSTYKVTTVFGYDAFGNLSSQAVTGVGMSTRTTTINWGTTGQFPTVITDPLSHVVTRSYDPKTGMLASQTDPNYTTSNPLTTSWTYDGFARKTQETKLDGTYTLWQYTDCTTSGGCFFGSHALALVHTIYGSNGSTINSGTTYFDQVDRPLIMNQLMLSGGYNRNEVRYDSLGRVVQQALPCTYAAVTTACPYWITNSYDVLNRLTESQRPISSTNSTLQTTLYGYAGRTSTIKDALSNTTTKITAVTGTMGQSKDAKGYYETFVYDSFGSLKSVTDSNSNNLFSANYAYGISAFQTSLSDMDLGARSFTLDALGEVTAYTDAKSQSFSQTYDALSRPLVRTEPDLTTTWTWGNTTTLYNIGKLQTVTAAGSAGTYTEAYTYDSKTRLSVDTKTLPGDAAYAYTWTYSATTGLLNTLQYPVSTSSYQLGLQYGYTNGILSSITDAQSSAVYWTANTSNPRGQITKETLGNGIVTNRAYDAVTGWVSSIEAGVSGGSGVQNNAFLYDYLGNVTQRQDNNQGLTENIYYDTDYRLDHSTLGGATNLQMTYDGGVAGPGNITARSDVASGTTWTYDPVRKHAVTQAGTGGYAYTYDGNGNAVTRNGYTVTWTSYNYPSGVNASGESATFQYGPDRQRWKTIYTGSIGTETTYHVGTLLEKVANGGTLDYRHYIFAGSELVGIYSRQSTGTNTVRYVLEDHQSSFASILTNTGTTDVSESFTAFGNRRNGETWSGAPTTADETAINGVSRQGYTGQTVLGVSMGLNHMNGRIQDAITGRFLSPDPTVPDPGKTQSFNRYSYVNNNPLTLTDPTGFEGESPQPIDPCDGPDGCGDPNEPDQLPPAGCGIPPYGPCPALAPTPPLDPPVDNPKLPWLEPNLSNCLRSVIFCNSQPKTQPPNTPPDKAPPAQGKNNQPSSQCRASLEKYVQAGSGAVGGLVSGALVGGGQGALAGFAAGGVTGFVTGSLSGAGAPDLFVGAVGAPVGAVSAAFASQAFAAEGATASGMLFSGYGGLFGGAIPGAGGAAAGAGISGVAGLSGLARTGVIGAAGALTAGLTYQGLNAVANSYCGP